MYLICRWFWLRFQILYCINVGLAWETADICVHDNTAVRALILWSMYMHVELHAHMYKPMVYVHIIWLYSVCVEPRQGKWPIMNNAWATDQLERFIAVPYTACGTETKIACRPARYGDSSPIADLQPSLIQSVLQAVCRTAPKDCCSAWVPANAHEMFYSLVSN